MDLSFIITSITASPGQTFASVTLTSVPGTSGEPVSQLTLQLSIADARTYEIGQTYTLSLTPVG